MHSFPFVPNCQFLDKRFHQGLIIRLPVWPRRATINSFHSFIQTPRQIHPLFSKDFRICCAWMRRTILAQEGISDVRLLPAVKTWWTEAGSDEVATSEWDQASPFELLSFRLVVNERSRNPFVHIYRAPIERLARSTGVIVKNSSTGFYIYFLAIACSKNKVVSGLNRAYWP